MVKQTQEQLEKAQRALAEQSRFLPSDEDTPEEPFGSPDTAGEMRRIQGRPIIRRKR